MQTEKKSYVNVALVHFEFVGKAPTMLLLIESRSPGFMLRNDLLPQLKQQQPLMPCQGFVESGLASSATRRSLSGFQSLATGLTQSLATECGHRIFVPDLEDKLDGDRP